MPIICTYFSIYITYLLIIQYSTYFLHNRLEVAMISYNPFPIVLAVTINGFHLYSYNVHVITVHVLLENCYSTRVTPNHLYQALL